MIWHRTGSNSETLVHLIASAPLPPEATLGMSLFFLMSSLPSFFFFFFKGDQGSSPAVQLLGLCIFTAKGPGLIPWLAN